MTDKEIIFKLINNQMSQDVPEKPAGIAAVGVAYPTNVIRAFGIMPDAKPENEMDVEFKYVNFDYIQKYYVTAELELVDINEYNIPIFSIKGVDKVINDK